MLWVEHLDNMEYLRDSVRLRAYGQQDPLVEYKNEGHKIFQRLLARIESDIIQTIFNVRLVEKPLQTVQPLSVQDLKNRPERNSPCPCGSGKKYKKCCLNK